MLDQRKIQQQPKLSYLYLRRSCYGDLLVLNRTVCVCSALCVCGVHDVHCTCLSISIRRREKVYKRGKLY